MEIITEQFIIRDSTWEDILVGKKLRKRVTPPEFNEYKIPEISLESEKYWWESQVLKGNTIVQSIYLKNLNLVGFIKAFSIYNNSCEIGIEILDPVNYGKGYAYKALKSFIPILINDFQVNNIIALIHPDNKRSIKLFEKLNFCFIGFEKDQEFEYMNFYKMKFHF